LELKLVSKKLKPYLDTGHKWGLADAKSPWARKGLLEENGGHEPPFERRV
jgi:hypothetical protein